MARRGKDSERSLEAARDRPLVALVGRPNVGKSSLFNRLVGGRPALVEDMPGVTRDRRYGVCDWSGARFRVVDTGGLDPSAEGILGAMRSQTLRALDEGDVLVFVVDVREGITAVDEDVARLLRRTGKPVFIAANKVDSVQPGRGRGRGVRARLRSGVPRLRHPRPRRGRAAGRGDRRAGRSRAPGARSPTSRTRPTTRSRLRRRRRARSAWHSWASRTSASRRWSTGCSGRSGCWCTTSPAPPAIPSTLRFAWASRTSCWWTPPACAAGDPSTP